MTLTFPTVPSIDRDAVTAVAFSAAAKTERFYKSHVQPTVKAHAPNLPTYALIVAVIVLTAIVKAFDFAVDQLERLPEYRLRTQLFYVINKRRVVRWAIKTEQFRLTYSPRFIAVMDRIFCLG